MAAEAGTETRVTELDVARAKFRGGPATRLQGETLDGGWTVGERLDRFADATGGLCSVGYIVRKEDGTEAYMKALDYQRAIREHLSRFSEVMGSMLDAYNHEKSLNDRCADARLSRVVKSLTAGALAVEHSEIPVNYIIFELAEGDVRQRLGRAGSSAAWKLRTLHQAAVGLSQLHSRGIIHQDIKPSNVLTFESEGAKIGDLGSAWFNGETAPLLDQAFGGDPDYAPPECLFGFELSDGRAKLLARDMYLLGSLIMFVLSGVDATTALITHLPADVRPQRSSHTFETALPYLREASDAMLDAFAAGLEIDEADEVRDLVSQLCDPDPRTRGDRYAIGRYANRFWLQRPISKLDRLASLTESKVE